MPPPRKEIGLSKSSQLWQRALAAFAQRFAARFENMPREKARKEGARLALMAYPLAKKARRTSNRNLAMVFGDTLTPAERDALTRRVFVNFGHATGEFLHGPSYTPEELLKLIPERIGWDEHGETAYAQGRGLLAITGHIGNFEIFARYVASLGLPLTVIARDPEDPVFGAYIKRLRTRAGYDVAAKGSASLRKVIGALNKNEIVGVLPDQNSADCFAPFFGVPAGTATGPAQLALKTNTPILPAFCVARPDGLYRILVYPAIEPNRNAPDKDAEIYRLTCEINAAIERVAREYPDQYLWLHNRWKATFESRFRENLPKGFDVDAARARWNSGA